jgi:transposase
MRIFVIEKHTYTKHIMSYIIPADRHQTQLFNSLEDQIEENNPVRIIDILVDKILHDNPDLIEQDEETGRPRYHDGTLLKILLYSYLHRVRSSRAIERECRLNRELNWLTGNLAPDHWTIAMYRVNSRVKIKKLTTLFRRFLRDEHYITGKLVAVDGTKIKANAKREMLSREKLVKRLTRVEKEMEAYLAEVEQADVAEDGEESVDTFTAEDNPMLAKLEESANEIARLHELIDRMTKADKTYVSEADWDAELMRTRNGKVAAFNAQFVVDAEHKLIADSEVITASNDMNQVGPMLTSYQEELQTVPEVAVFDSGYMAPEDIASAEAQFAASGTPVEIVVAPNKKPEREVVLEYNAEEDKYYCSEAKTLELVSRNIKKGESRADMYRGVACEGCLKREGCTKAEKGRIHYRYHNQVWRDAYEKMLTTDRAKALIRRRKTLSEHPNGTIKWMMGQVQLLLRGVEKAAIEMNLLTTCYNLKRLFTLSSFKLIIAQILGHKWQIE